MSLEKAVRDYLRYHDQNLGDDYFDAERRAVRMPLDEALKRGDAVRAAAVALVETAFDYSFSIEDEDDRRGLYAPLVNLLNALGMTEDEIAAPGRALRQQRDAEDRTRTDAEHVRRRALTQEERDAEDLARWNAMSDSEKHLLYVQMALSNPDAAWSVTGSKDGTWGSWRHRTAEEPCFATCAEGSAARRARTKRTP